MTSTSRVYPKCTKYNFSSSKVGRDAARMAIKDADLYWKLVDLAKDAMLDPTWTVGSTRQPANGSKGLGRPESLTKETVDSKVKYSRRSDGGTRLVYYVEGNCLIIDDIVGYHRSKASVTSDLTWLDDAFSSDNLL
jgi:Txe/YoeB family toxin of Txe-Axe toxin-antitoxin module